MLKDLNVRNCNEEKSEFDWLLKRCHVYDKIIALKKVENIIILLKSLLFSHYEIMLPVFRLFRHILFEFNCKLC